MMKIKTEHYKTMENRINTWLLNKGQSLTEVLNNYGEAGLSEKRFRWDLSYAAIGSSWICDNLYPYLNDTHIDTALRTITKTK